MTRILNDSKKYFLSLTMSDLVSGISTINMVECLGTPDQNLSLVLDSFYDNSQEQIAGLHQILLYSHFESASKSERWSSYFNSGTFCGIVELWCGLQWPLTGFIEMFEQNTVDVLLYFVSYIQVQIQNKNPFIQPGYPLRYLHNVTVLFILFALSERNREPWNPVSAFFRAKLRKMLLKNSRGKITFYNYASYQF